MLLCSVFICSRGGCCLIRGRILHAQASYASSNMHATLHTLLCISENQDF